ncbi:MAG TPA: lipoprotein-releasing ABC transporter permease subunit, partial [Burkholderiaceae bacterium]|nr:lipoprotein-releasing ABC transporter permease subunit [Burkholderiaceae bacterium]
DGFISFISLISAICNGLGVWALIVVLSVMNGFQKDVRDKMLSVLSHIEISHVDGALPNGQALARFVRDHAEVVATAPYVSGQAMFSQGDVFRGALVRGVDPTLEPTVSDVAGQLRVGDMSDLRAGEFGIVLGSALAQALGARVGQKVTLIAPQGNVTPAGVVPRLKQFRVVAIFESGHFEYDASLALMHIEDAQRFFRVAGPTGLRLRLADMHRAPQVAGQLGAQLVQQVDSGLMVRDWSQQNRTWFAAVQTEKVMMFIILSVIVIVGAFGLVSTLVMTVTEKQSDIAILRTLGASPGAILRIFVVQGAFIGVLGVGLGVGLGLLTALNIDAIVPAIESVLGVQFLPQEIYFISQLPSDPRASDIVPITLISLILSWAATMYPAWRAARTRPAQALRYE